jgi:Tfp pilus assembly protein PilN
MRQVNLLPEESRKAETILFIRNTVGVILGPFVGILLIVNFFIGAHIDYLRRTAEQPLASKETSETLAMKKQIEKYEENLKQTGVQNKDIVETFVKKVPAGYLLKMISRLAEDKVWLDGISVDVKERRCTVDGKSFGTRLVSEFMLELKRLPHFKDVELVSVGKETRKTAQEVDFQIICFLK